jgi:hypothetical protein
LKGDETAWKARTDFFRLRTSLSGIARLPHLALVTGDAGFGIYPARRRDRGFISLFDYSALAAALSFLSLGGSRAPPAAR